MKNIEKEIIEYDNDKLIQFYIRNGLEFDENRGYFGTDVKSFALLIDNKIIGAVSISIYKNKSFIEALAVDKNSRGQGYGNMLLSKAIENLSGDIYVISKVDEIYLNKGFEYSNEDLLGKECKSCEEYNVSCFPRVMIHKK